VAVGSFFVVAVSRRGVNYDSRGAGWPTVAGQFTAVRLASRSISAAVQAVRNVNKAQTRDIGETGERHYLHLAVLREVRSRWVNLLNREADRLPMSERPWFRITEIADHCAKTAGSVELDIAKRERTVELLRQAILRGEFKDARERSTVACLHMSPIAPLRFDRESAAEPIFFQQAVAHLWLNRADTELWFKRNALTFPWKAKPPDWASDQMPGLQGPALERQRKNKWQLKDTRPLRPATGAAWDFIRQHPQVLENSQSIDAIATKIEKFRANMPPAARIGGGFSASAITKALVNNQPQKQRTKKAPVTNSAE
jgi:hypothetical protein